MPAVQAIVAAYGVDQQKAFPVLAKLPDKMEAVLGKRAGVREACRDLMTITMVK